MLLHSSHLKLLIKKIKNNQKKNKQKKLNSSSSSGSNQHSASTSSAFALGLTTNSPSKTSPKFIKTPFFWGYYCCCPLKRQLEYQSLR